VILARSSRGPTSALGLIPFHTPRQLREAAENVFLSQGWSVGIDWPYAGVLVPMDYYGTDRRVRAIMVEVRRGLYMDEGGGVKLEGVDEFLRCLHECLNKIMVLSM